MIFSTPIPQKKNNIYINVTIRMQVGRSAFFVFVLKRICFSAFKRQRSWIASLFAARRPLSGAWLGKENHPRSAPVFSFPKPCAKRQSKGREPIKSGKHIPMGLFILKIIKNMKLQLIEKISRQAVALVLLAGICLLYNKGIVPVYTIVLFLFSGTIIGFFFRTLSFVIKIILVLLLAGMFV